MRLGRLPALLALGLLASQCLPLPTPHAMAEEEYSPLNQAATYNRPPEAAEKQAGFLLASLADRQRLAVLEMELQTLAAQPNPNQTQLKDLDSKVKELRAQLLRVAKEMGGYLPDQRSMPGDCGKPDRQRGGGLRGTGMGGRGAGVGGNW